MATGRINQIASGKKFLGEPSHKFPSITSRSGRRPTDNRPNFPLRILDTFVLVFDCHSESEVPQETINTVRPRFDPRNAVRRQVRALAVRRSSLSPRSLQGRVREEESRPATRAVRPLRRNAVLRLSPRFFRHFSFFPPRLPSHGDRWRAREAKGGLVCHIINLIE